MPSTILRPGDPQFGPLVCVHPVTGRIDDYHRLAEAIDWPGPVVGLSAPEPGDTGFVLAELAARYAAELEAVHPARPARPVRLLGWALGGVIAAELSRAITARGGTVAFLGILDGRAPPPEMRTRPTDRDTLVRAYLQHQAFIREHEPPALASTALPELLAALRAIGVGPDEIADEADLARQHATFMALVRALFQHDQQPVPVAIHLFGSDAEHPKHPRPPTLGWDHLAPRIEHGTVGGTHHTLMAPRRTTALAAAISAAIRSAGTPPSR